MSGIATWLSCREAEVTSALTGKPTSVMSRCSLKPFQLVLYPLAFTLVPRSHAVPTACDRGTKVNAKGYKTSWNGIKLHLDITDVGLPVSALVTSASLHDSQVAIPVSYTHLRAHETGR